jgi:hypothetical protein
MDDLHTSQEVGVGLGIKDLDKFGKTLHLRSLWHLWDAQERLWKSLLRYHDKIDRALFFALTHISVGNGDNTPF